MMPELGRYAVEVSAAYGLSLALIGALVAWYALRARAVRRQLHEVENRRGSNA